MRHIASETFADEYFGTLPMMMRVLWVGLIAAVADDQGRFIDNAALIRSIIFPYDEKVSIKDIDNALTQFSKAKKIERYTHGMNGSGKRLIQIINWWKYQKSTQWAAESIHPAPNKWTDRVRIHKPGLGNVPYTLHWDYEGGYAQPTKEVATHLSTRYTKTKTKTKTKRKTKTNTTTPIPPASKQQGATASGGGKKNSLSTTINPKTNPSNWLSTLHGDARTTAEIMLPILTSSGIGIKKIETFLPKVATRILPTDAKRYALAALASSYSDPDVQKPAIVAAHRMENDSVPVQFMISETWRKLPAQILKAANVDVERLPRANDVIRKVAANVG